MRKGCLNCVRKHLAQAEILSHEANNGYPLHKYLAAGHLAEAEAEAEEVSPALMKGIRKVRLEYMDDVSDLDAMTLIEWSLTCDEDADQQNQD